MKTVSLFFPLRTFIWLSLLVLSIMFGLVFSGVSRAQHNPWVTITGLGQSRGSSPSDWNGGNPGPIGPITGGHHGHHGPPGLDGYSNPELPTPAFIRGAELCPAIDASSGGSYWLLTRTVELSHPNAVAEPDKRIGVFAVENCFRQMPEGLDEGRPQGLPDIYLRPPDGDIELITTLFWQDLGDQKGNLRAEYYFTANSPVGDYQVEIIDNGSNTLEEFTVTPSMGATATAPQLSPAQSIAGESSEPTAQNNATNADIESTRQQSSTTLQAVSGSIVRVNTSTPPDPAGLRVLNFRVMPGTHSAKVGWLRTGQSVTIIGGPQVVGAYTWYNVRETITLTEGWVAADYLELTTQGQ